ncbi:MAG: TIGR04255 family protein [Candidatus Aminicenantales bacterium]|jgi:uncharacterized protein (TIGR04255 family)
MAEQRHLRNAPITEALIDIRIRIKEGFDVSRLLSLHQHVAAQYPEKNERFRWEGKFNVAKGEPPASAGTTVDGYLFIAADKKQIFQSRLDGFTFNRLMPYDKWETFRLEAHRLWQLYSDLISPEIIRVAVRYINKMNIPLPIAKFTDYLVAAPIVPEGLPQGVSSFLTRVVMPSPETGVITIITQAFEQVVEPQVLPIILDIDVFKERELFSEKEAWDTLDLLREIKNKAFFSSITDKAEELFR